jgi:hypothetical protein
MMSVVVAGGGEVYFLSTTSLGQVLLLATSRGDDVDEGAIRI